MKFLIKASNNSGKQELLYLEDECSFFMEGNIDHTEMELIVNKVSLAVFENKVINVSGFCGFNEWMKSNYQVPEYRKGILKVEHNLEFGFAYGINDEEYPVFVNVQTGWVCIGNPKKIGKAVEFINNCIAVIDNNKEFVSLWLKPQSLPNI